MSDITGMIDTASMDNQRPKDYRQAIKNLALTRFRNRRMKKPIETFKS